MSDQTDHVPRKRPKSKNNTSQFSFRRTIHCLRPALAFEWKRCGKGQKINPSSSSYALSSDRARWTSIIHWNRREKKEEGRNQVAVKREHHASFSSKKRAARNRTASCCSFVPWAVSNAKYFFMTPFIRFNDSSATLALSRTPLQVKGLKKSAHGYFDKSSSRADSDMGENEAMSTDAIKIRRSVTRSDGASNYTQNCNSKGFSEWVPEPNSAPTKKYREYDKKFREKGVHHNVKVKNIR